MKPVISLLLALGLAGGLCACAGGTASPTPSAPPPAETVSPSPNPSEESETPRIPTNYLNTFCTLRPGVDIRRTVLDTGDYPLDCYFEAPFFFDTGEGFDAINAFFQDLEKEFFSPESENLIGAWDSALHGNAKYGLFYQRTVRSVCLAEDLVSVYLDSYWYMGGVNDTGGDCYNFDPTTGERLFLTDLTTLSEEELMEQIAQCLTDAGFDGSAARSRDLDSFDCYVDDGTLFLQFDRYEVGVGATGSPVLALSAPLARGV